MMKCRCKTGLTLAELLIVLAILSVLTAVSLPVFASHVERSREAVDLTILRSAYALAAMDVITGAYKERNSDGFWDAATENGYLLASERGTNATYYAFYDSKHGKLATIPPAEKGKGTRADGGIEVAEGPLCYWGTTAANNGYPAVVIQEQGGAATVIRAGFLPGELPGPFSESSFLR